MQQSGRKVSSVFLILVLVVAAWSTRACGTATPVDQLVHALVGDSDPVSQVALGQPHRLQELLQ